MLASLVSTTITHLVVFLQRSYSKWKDGPVHSTPRGSHLTAAQAERGMLNKMYLLNPGPPSYITVQCASIGALFKPVIDIYISMFLMKKSL